jgi:predicted enzyme related to lactoylglutathione lyase
MDTVGGKDGYQEGAGDQSRSSKNGQGRNPKMNTISFPSVDKCTKKIQDKGGKILMPKMAIPSVGLFAACPDTRKIFGIIGQTKAK